MERKKIIALINCAGIGERFGAPKQYICVEGKPLFMYCLEAFDRVEEVDTIAICVRSEWKKYVQYYTKSLNKPCHIITVNTQSAQETRKNGVEEIIRLNVGKTIEDTLIIFHDAARPFIRSEMIQGLIQAAIWYNKDQPVITIRKENATVLELKGELRKSDLKSSDAFFASMPQIYPLKYACEMYDIPIEELEQTCGPSDLIKKDDKFGTMMISGMDSFHVTELEDLVPFLRK